MAITHVTVRLDGPLCGCRKPAVSTAFDFDEEGSLWLLVHCVMCKKGVRKPLSDTEFRLSWPKAPT